MTQSGHSLESSPYDFFEVNKQPIIGVARLPGEAIVEQVHAEHPEIEERPYQIECLASLSNLRRQGENRALIHMATGLGKTTVAALDVKDFLQDKPGARVLFVSHQNEILRQAHNRFEYIIGDQYSYGSFTGEDRKGIDADCVFGSFQLLHTSREAFEPNDFDYIVVDESHHGKATTYEPSLDYFKPKFLLGMTATPDRRDLKEIRDIFGNEIYSKTLEQALSERLLARPDYRVVLDDIDEVLLHQPGVTIGMLNKKLFIPKRNEEIASIIAEKTKGIERPKTIVFCPSIEHANQMAQLLPGAEALHSDRTQNERRIALDRFIHNGIPTLTTVDIFNEGVDVADANIIVFMRSTESEVIFQQQLGRGLRKMPGKDSVLVLDFVASCDRLVMIHDLLGQYVNKNQESEGDPKSEEPYGLDFSPKDNTPELNIASLEFKETTRRIIELLKNMKRPMPIDSAPEGWVALKDISAEHGRTTAQLVKRARKLGLTAIRYLTEQGTPALHIAALDIPALKEKTWAEKSDDDIVQAALEISPEKPLTFIDIAQLSKDKQFISYGNLLKRFGTLGNFQRACGHEGRTVETGTMTNDEIVELANRLSPSKPLATQEIIALSRQGIFVSERAIRDRFGSTDNFQRACGYDIESRPSRKDVTGLDDKAIIILARELSPKEPLSQTEIEDLSREGRFVSMSSIRGNFGSLVQFQRACGFEVDAPTSRSDRLVLDSREQIVDLAKWLSPDKPLTKRVIGDLAKTGEFVSEKQIKKNFGTLSNFQQACGFEPNSDSSNA